MHGHEHIAQALVSAGVVHRVDTVSREVAVFVDGELLAFDVPVGCAVVLHGEPVKLRMVQPRDRVRITYASRGGLRLALTIDVQPDGIAGCAARPPWVNRLDDEFVSARLHKEELKRDTQTSTPSHKPPSRQLRPG